MEILKKVHLKIEANLNGQCLKLLQTKIIY